MIHTLFNNLFQIQVQENYMVWFKALKAIQRKCEKLISLVATAAEQHI
jgi:hypothetical protein